MTISVHGGDFRGPAELRVPFFSGEPSIVLVAPESSFWRKTTETLPLSAVVEVEAFVTTTSGGGSSGGLGAAVAGGMLLGGAGMVAGAVLGKKNAKIASEVTFRVRFADGRGFIGTGDATEFRTLLGAVATNQANGIGDAATATPLELASGSFKVPAGKRKVMGIDEIQRAYLESNLKKPK